MAAEYTPVMPFEGEPETPVDRKDGDAGSDDDGGELHEAVYKDDVATVAALLAAGADATELDCHGMTPLHFCRSRETADLLLAAGAVPWALSHAGVPAACSVIGSSALAAVLDAAGPGEVHSGRLADFRNRLPAHHSADVTGTAGVDDADGAAAMGVLFSRGFSPNSADACGQTPLMFAAIHAPLTAMAILEAGGDPRAVTNLGATALHACCGASLARELVARGADPSAKLLDGSTPLHTNDVPEVVAALVELGADVNARIDFSLHTPLHLAEKKDHALALVAAGADLEARNFDGDTPLIARADCKNPNAETIAALLDAGADPSAVSNNGACVISCYAGLPWSGRLAVAEAVARSLARADAMRFGVGDGRAEALEEILKMAYPGIGRGARPGLGSIGISSINQVATGEAEAAPDTPEVWTRVEGMPLTAVTSYNPTRTAGAADDAADGGEATAYQMDPVLVAEFYRFVAAESCLLASKALREAQRARQESSDHVASLGHWIACAVRTRDMSKSTSRS
jgi:ankyrin repeat protein